MHDFFYRMNVRTLYLLSIPSGYRYFLTFIVASSLVSTWFFCAYKPLVRSLKEHKHLQNASKVLSNKTDMQEDYSDKRKLIEAAQCTYAKEVHALQNMRFLDVVNEIFKMLAKYNLTFCSYTPQGMFDEGIFVKYALMFELKGSFAALQAFLHDIEKSNYLLIPDTIRISKNASNELSCTCMIHFMQIKEESDAK